LPPGYAGRFIWRTVPFSPRASRCAGLVQEPLDGQPPAVTQQKPERYLSTAQAKQGWDIPRRPARKVFSIFSRQKKYMG